MKRDVDRSYLAIVVLLMLVLPLASLLIETREPGLALVGKWWNFWAIGGIGPLAIISSCRHLDLSAMVIITIDPTPNRS